MALRPIAFSIPSTTQLKVTFSDTISENISSDNFEIQSLNGAVNDLEIIGVTIENNVVTVKTRPQVAGNYYLLKFLDTKEIPFTSVKGFGIPFDSVSRELFFVGIDDINPFRDRMFEEVPSLFEIENTNLKNIISAQAQELYTAQKKIGEVLSNNYLSVDVVDEFRTRTAGATDRLANENAYEIYRVAKNPTGSAPKFEVLDYTASNTLPRSQVLSVFPVSLQQVAVEDEEININSESNSFNGFLLNLKNKNVIKLLSVKLIENGEEIDCDGNIGTEYDIERYKYSIKDNFYDQDYAFKFSSLESNQILLSEFGNLSRPSSLDTYIVSYLYKDVGKFILEELVEVSRVEESINESVPTNTTNFFLNHAPIVNIDNEFISLGGVTFASSENSDEIPEEFSHELVYNSNRLPSQPGEYSINYQTGEVFLVGATKIGEGTGRNNYVTTYFYRKEFKKDLDYSIYQQNLVATPDRDLSNQEAEIFIRYDKTYAEGIDYLAKSHIEVMPEFVENRLTQSFRIKTKNAPITNVFRILNQTTGEVYNPLYHTNTEIVFSGNSSPQIKNVTGEEVNFEKISDEELSVIGEFVIPAFRVLITSNVSNSNITFTPGIPAELISQNSTDYFFREVEEENKVVNVSDINIRFFGTPNSKNLITSAAINSTATPPANGSQVIIGTKGFIINLSKEGILNKNLDSLGSLTNTSVEFSDKSTFIRERYFEDIEIITESIETSDGGISVALIEDKGTTFDFNISRLRKVGDYAVDYRHGVVYLAISKDQDVAVGNINYACREINTRNSNILTVSSVAKKKNSPDPLTEASIVYNQISYDSETIDPIDLEDTLTLYDGETKATTPEGDRQLIAVMLEDYTAVVPHDINTVNGIYILSDLRGKDLKSSSPDNRVEDYSADQLNLLAKSGGRNLYDVSSITFEENVIDFKKKQKRRVVSDGQNLTVSILDANAETFVQAKIVSNDEVFFDQDLNISKVEDLEIVAVESDIDTAIISIASGVDLSDIDDDDYLLDSDGNRFTIQSVDTRLSTITVYIPSENTDVSSPTLGSAEVIVKPTVSIENGIMTISIPLDAGIQTRTLLEITYLTNLIPDVGTPLAIDYHYGFVFADYSYVANELIVWYEYGDNELDWSISDTLEEGEEYYVSYKFGALRDALRVNFGSLTNIPFFKSFGVNTDRELYRDAIKGTLQSFPKGPTILSYKELVKSFTKINPEIDELIFGNWILGRDYLHPGQIKYEGVLNFSGGKFDDGLIFNDDVVVNIPAISSISLDEGTFETWVRPDWAGINNDATLTFDLDNIGPEKIFLKEKDNPFDRDHNWELIPSDNLVGGTDALGPGVNIFNYRSNSSEDYGLDVGVYGIYKNQENLDRITKASFNATMKLGLIGSHFNDLRKVITPEQVTLCEGETNEEGYFVVGSNGPGNIIEGPWSTAGAQLTSNYSPASFFVADGERSVGFSLSLKEVSGFNFEVSPRTGNGGILEVSNTDLPQYDRPHQTKNCFCTIENNVSELLEFRDLIVDIELEEAFDFTDFKNAYNFIDSDPSIFILIDSNGIFYEVVGFYNSRAELDKKIIPDTATKLAVKKFGINNPSLSTMGSAEINSTLPTGILRLYSKAVDILTKADYSNSTLAFDFQKTHILDWSEYHEYGLIRDPIQNLVNITIDSASTKLFYTDTFYSCNLAFNLNIESEDLKGILIGPMATSILTNLELLRTNGIIYNRYGVNDIYIGKEGYNPTKSIFSLNRNDFPKITVGEPANANLDEGIFIWYDELCLTPILEDTGQWVFRARSSRNVSYATDVIVRGENDYTNTMGSYFPAHQFSGVITTDGEFSSVSRSFREETQGGCDTGIICQSTFRYCGNEPLEEFGWNKIEESDSDLINTIIGGRETQKGFWRKHGEFDTTSSSGVYRMGPTADESDCVDQDNYLGNLVYTRNPCAGGDFEYIVSLKVVQVDSNIASGTLGIFSGATSGNITGIVPVHINDGELDLKIALALSTTGQPLVLIIDAANNKILDIIPYVWNNELFHEFRVEKSEDDGRITLYIDNYLVSKILISSFSTPVFNESSNFSEPFITLYVFDNTTVDSLVFHQTYSPNIIDINLIFFSGTDIAGDGYLESSDVLINTDSRIEFTFNIDDLDGYIPVTEGYDGYEGYGEFIGVDEMFITSDRLRYLIDTGFGEADRRFSIFKDGKGFLNFRICDDSLSKGGEAGIFNLATNIKRFKPGELHHVAASWKLNTIDEKDEMHLFIDGQEAPNIFKFGGKIPVRINDKFRDVSKEILYDFLVKDIDFCQEYTDGTIIAGGSVFRSNQVGFTQDMVGRSLLITASDIAPTLIGGEYIIKSVVDSTQITLGRGSNLDLVTFQVSASDIEFKFPPTAGIISPVLTDLRNSRIAIFRTTPDETVEEMAGVFYSVENGEVTIEKGENVNKPKFRVNLTEKLIEFVGENTLCQSIATVEPTDIDVHVETFGLNLENCKHKMMLSSSSYDAHETLFSGKSVLRTRGTEPVSLEDVRITRIILDKTVVDILNPTEISGLGYRVDFEVEIDNTNNFHSLTSQSGQVTKQNLGRLLTIIFDSDNINFCNDGYGELNNYITISGSTIDGYGEETFEVNKNGRINGSQYFTEVTNIFGSLIVSDPDYFEAAMISVEETNPISVSDNDGESAEIYDYKNGNLILTTVGSSGTFPFELHPGYYNLEYPAHLTVNLPQVGDKLYVGSDFNKKNQFGGVIDEFRIISEMSSDTRITEEDTSGTRSVTDDYNKSIPFCPDTQTLALIHFNNPIELQSRRLRNTEFLDRVNNIKYKLSRTRQEELLEVVNDSRKFISKMLNWGFNSSEAERVFYEVHRAENGPLFNEADYYRNVEEFPKSDNSVNSLFKKSGNFTNGRGLLMLNNDGKFNRKQGTIEFWVSPIIDTFVDQERRYYVDIYTAKKERVTSKTSTVIELPNAAGEILSIKLLQKTQEFSSFYTSDEASSILFDEISRSEITGVLEGGTGVEKDFSIGATLSADGKKVLLAESLPGQKIDVVVTYIPSATQGDRVSIFKNEDSQVVFAITADGIDNVVSIDVDWKKNTWHRVKCVYQTGTTNDIMRIFVDGEEGDIIRYGTGLLYGEGYLYGQRAQGDGQIRNAEYTIPLGDEFKLIAIGADIFGDNSARARMDNLRFSKNIRDIVRDVNGNIVDINYSANTNSISPVVKDDITTLLVDFDEDEEKIDKFTTIVDPKRGIYNFDISVIDNFDRVIGVNNGEVEDLIVDLVNRLKPAHTNALVKFKKNRC